MLMLVLPLVDALRAPSAAATRSMFSAAAPRSRATTPYMLLRRTNSSTSFNIDEASMGIRKELYARSDQVADMVARSERRRNQRAPPAELAVAFDSVRMRAALVFRVTPAWIDVGLGCILFLLLNGIAREALSSATPSPTTDILAARALALAAFVLVQQYVGGTPPDSLLEEERIRARSSNPLFNSGSPLAGVTFAFMFAVPVAVLAQLAQWEWLPQPAPFPDGAGAALTLLVSPLSEEVGSCTNAPRPVLLAAAP